jgi:putative membrane protein
MLIKLIIVFVALQHLAFFVLESYLWTHPIGLKVFRQSLDLANISKPLAINQGLYNSFIAAGLVWSLVTSNDQVREHFQIFFLICVILAGLVGGLTVNYRITLIQALPALFALALILKFS